MKKPINKSYGDEKSKPKVASKPKTKKGGPRPNSGRPKDHLRLKFGEQLIEDLKWMGRGPGNADPGEVVLKKIRAWVKANQDLIKKRKKAVRDGKWNPEENEPFVDE